MKDCMRFRLQDRPSKICLAGYRGLAVLDQEFFRAAFKEGEITLGDAVAKALKGYRLRGGMLDVISTYTLLGDPAERLP